MSDPGRSVPLVTVIPTAGRPDLLRRTLESLAEAEKPGVPTRTLVVENGPPSGARSVVEDVAGHGADYLYVAVANKSHALNTALEEIGGDALIYFTDDDVRFARGTLTALVQAAQGMHRGAFFGGSVRIDYEVPPPPWLTEFLPYSARGWDVADPAAQEQWPYFLGCNWAAFSADLKAVGGFDTRYGPGSPTQSTGQDRRMQARLKEAGVRQIPVPAAVVWHWVPRDTCTPEWILDRNFRNGVRAGLRHLEENGRAWGPQVLLWRRLLGATVRAALASMSRDPRKRLGRLRRLYYYRGMLQGVSSPRPA